MQGLRCERLGVAFGGVSALIDVDITLQPGRITAIIGPNGAGKTTLFNVLTGLLKPDSGRCYLGEREVTWLPPHRIARLGVARAFQELRLIQEMSVLDNVLLAAPPTRGETLYGALLGLGAAEEMEHGAQAAQILRFVGLADQSSGAAGELSYGQQKLLSLACCVATGASILLLDEPIAGVHPKLAEEILTLLVELRGRGTTIVFVEHDLEAVRRFAEHIIVMDGGRTVAEGPPETVLNRPEVLGAYLA
jgi:ABC-type branched-subunit amino acid transport system ATPase component